MHVLRRMVEAVVPGGLVLDLQVIRPNPVVETGGRHLCEIDGEPLFARADAATAAVDVLVRTERLNEEAVDDHDVRARYDNGTDLIAAFADKQRRLSDDALAVLRLLTTACTVRERCRLRRLGVA